MSGSAWKPKNKTAEQQFEEAIMAPEYYDLEVPTLQEYRKQQWTLVKGTDKEPYGLAACMAFNYKLEELYKKLYK